MFKADQTLYSIERQPQTPDGIKDSLNYRARENLLEDKNREEGYFLDNKKWVHYIRFYNIFYPQS
jgi:hypothetical protein